MFLNKKFFTPEDRQAVDDILAKAVILDMIRSGRKVTDTSPVGIERAYHDEPEATLSAIKSTAAFREAKNNLITPDGLRKFFTESRQTGINKEISTGAAKQHKEAKAEMQNQPQFQYQRQAGNAMQQGQAQAQGQPQAAQPQQPGPVPQVGPKG